MRPAFEAKLEDWAGKLGSYAALVTLMSGGVASRIEEPTYEAKLEAWAQMYPIYKAIQ